MPTVMKDGGGLTPRESAGNTGYYDPNRYTRGQSARDPLEGAPPVPPGSGGGRVRGKRNRGVAWQRGYYRNGEWLYAPRYNRRLGKSGDWVRAQSVDPSAPSNAYISKRDYNLVYGRSPAASRRSGSPTGAAMASGGSSGASGGSSAAEPKPTAEERNRKLERTRPPYWSRERYFDAKKNKWQWRWRYSATNAEILARRRGLSKDQQGYYSMRDGRKVYKTGAEGDRRYHYETRNGQRKRIWDDPGRWPRDVNKKRKRLRTKVQKAQSKLQSLREQYAHVRKDNFVLRRNIARRMGQIEADVARYRHQLKKLPAYNPFLLNEVDDKPKYKEGILVSIDFATEPESGTSLAFSPKLTIARNARVYARATIHIGDRQWRPGLLGAPEVMRVVWTYPRGWITLDKLGRATNEFIVSNPLYITRVFRSPGAGDTTPEFSCKVYLYEFAYKTTPASTALVIAEQRIEDMPAPEPTDDLPTYLGGYVDAGGAA